MFDGIRPRVVMDAAQEAVVIEESGKAAPERSEARIVALSDVPPVLVNPIDLVDSE
jgi:hypothetical protein